MYYVTLGQQELCDVKIHLVFIVVISTYSHIVVATLRQLLHDLREVYTRRKKYENILSRTHAKIETAKSGSSEWNQRRGRD